MKYVIDMKDEANWLNPSRGYNPDGSVSEDGRTIVPSEDPEGRFCFTDSVMHKSPANGAYNNLHEHWKAYETFFVESSSMYFFINGKKTLVEAGKIIHMHITRVPLSRRGAGIMLFYETDGAAHDAENGLYLSRSTEGVLMGGAEFYRNKNYLLITPVFEGTPVRYTYEATTGGRTITAHEGSIQMVFAGDGSLRVFAEGLGIRLTAKMGFGDVAVSHGKAASAEMDGVTYFMVPTVGSITVDSHYELLTYRYSDPVFEWIPDNGKLEIAVFERQHLQRQFLERSR